MPTDSAQPRLPLRAALIFVMLTLPAGLSAQSGDEGAVPPAPTPAASSHAVAAPVASALRITDGPSIDGTLDEEFWARATPITSLTQTEPNEGAPVSEPTDIRIAYDDSNLYVGARLTDRGEIRTVLARRDAGMGDSDSFMMTIDSYHDHQTAYLFGTNPSGTRTDMLVTGDGHDNSWDPVWDVATSHDDEGWTAEMRIPFSQLRFRPDVAQRWGIQFTRRIQRNQEQANFAFTPRLERGGVQSFGHLDGIREIQSARKLELLPYVTGRAEFVQRPKLDGGFQTEGFRDDSEAFTGAGLDLKYRITSNLTFDATVNPDFGQVEVDPAVINLTAFETRYQERRPFFVEGAEIFRFGQGGPTGSTGRPAEVLYSRRIGRSPQGSAPANALLADEPSATTILGAAKLTGKVGAGWSIGFLDAVTASEKAHYLDPSGIARDIAVEPAANYLVARARRDTNRGGTRLGAVFTAVNRDFGSEFLRGRLHTAAYTTGVDLIHEWDDRTWRLSSSLSPSYVTGDPAAILRTQQTSTRYFQRPDADHLEVDSTATSLAGYYAMMELNKQAGTWTGRLGLGATSPGYEVNDIGFQSYADRLIVDTHFQYADLEPGRYLREWNFGGGPDNIWNYDGQHVLSNINLQANLQWNNYWRTGFRVEITPEVYDDRLTRGGPISRSPSGLLSRFNFSTDSRSPHSLNGSISYFSDEAGSWSRNLNTSVSFRPRENWSISAGPEYSRSYSTAQYVTTLIDPRATNTFGRRYLFAGLDQTTFGIDTRVNVTFSPTLSFEMYAQPFISSGEYATPQQLSAPGVFDFQVFGEDVGTATLGEDGFWTIDPVGSDPANAFRIRDRDFTFRSLLGNAVLRWEWRPGSTLYLVWQQSREETLTGLDGRPGAAPIGQLDWTRDARELFGIRPNNVFAIKLNYWLNP